MNQVKMLDYAVKKFCAKMALTLPNAWKHLFLQGFWWVGLKSLTLPLTLPARHLAITRVLGHWVGLKAFFVKTLNKFFHAFYFFSLSLFFLYSSSNFSQLRFVLGSRYRSSGFVAKTLELLSLYGTFNSLGIPSCFNCLKGVWRK